MKCARLNLFSANLSWLFNHLLSSGSLQIILVLLFSQTNEIRLVCNSSALLPPHYLLGDWHNFGLFPVFCHLSFPIVLKAVIDGRGLMSLLCKWFLCSHLLWSDSSRVFTNIVSSFSKQRPYLSALAISYDRHLVTVESLTKTDVKKYIKYLANYRGFLFCPLLVFSGLILLLAAAVLIFLKVVFDVLY